MLLFAPPEAHRRIQERLNALLHVPFKFEFSGSQIIFFDNEEDYSVEEQARATQPIQVFRELSPHQNEGAPEPVVAVQPQSLSP